MSFNELQVLLRYNMQITTQFGFLFIIIKFTGQKTYQPIQHYTKKLFSKKSNPW